VVAWLDMENPIKNAPNLVPNEDISYEEALELAAGIAKLWNLKINAEIENNDNSGKEERAMPLRNYFNSGFCSKMQKG